MMENRRITKNMVSGSMNELESVYGREKVIAHDLQQVLDLCFCIPSR